MGEVEIKEGLQGDLLSMMNTHNVIQKSKGQLIVKEHTKIK
jgi:hypothetical protein